MDASQPRIRAGEGPDPPDAGLTRTSDGTEIQRMFTEDRASVHYLRGRSPRHVEESRRPERGGARRAVCGTDAVPRTWPDVCSRDRHESTRHQQSPPLAPSRIRLQGESFVFYLDIATGRGSSSRLILAAMPTATCGRRSSRPRRPPVMITWPAPVRPRRLAPTAGCQDLDVIEWRRLRSVRRALDRQALPRLQPHPPDDAPCRRVSVRIPVGMSRVALHLSTSRPPTSSLNLDAPFISS